MKTKLEITLNREDIKKAIQDFVRANHQTEVRADQIEFDKDRWYTEGVKASIVIETSDEVEVKTAPIDIEKEVS